MELWAASSTASVKTWESAAEMGWAHPQPLEPKDPAALAVVSTRWQRLWVIWPPAGGGGGGGGAGDEPDLVVVAGDGDA